MKKSLIIIVFGLFVLAVMVPGAQAQMCGCMNEKGGGMHEGGMMMGGMGHQEMGMMQGGMMDGGGMWKQVMSLGLDDKQKESLKALRSRMMKEMAKRKADKQIAAIEQKDLMDKDPLDLKAVEASAKKNASLSAEMFLAHVKAHEEMKSILTADQRKRLKEMMEDGGHGPGCKMMGGEAEHKDMPMHEHAH
jgi:Spy/CpxP family protein refolding chaperone